MGAVISYFFDFRNEGTLTNLLRKTTLIGYLSPHAVALPTNFDSWKSLYWQQDGFGWQWELLRTFFANKGYSLYVYRGERGLKPEVENDPDNDSFGLLGVRTDFRPIPLFWCNRAEVWGARDTKNRDVVIKPVSHGNTKTNELRILEFLNSDMHRADKTNATVPVIEFIEHSGWTFSVTPRWSESTDPEFVDVGEVLDWALQLIAAVAFLHRNHIAHLDISHENFLMNFWGVSQPSRDFGRKPPKLRGHFPVKYALIDFGHSIQFLPNADPSSYLGIWTVPRQQRAPETTTGNPFDPFAADVYQTSRTIYGWCRKFIDDIPGVLAVLQDMTRSRPDARLNATEACSQMSAAIGATACTIKDMEVPTSLLGEFEEVPPRMSLYVYGCSPY